MLKIKAEKISELENFEFGKYPNVWVWNDGAIQISVSKHTGLINLTPFSLDCTTNQFVLQKFYDLIKADMVEEINI